MLDHFKQTLTKLLATGKERIDFNRVRGSLERLEDRTMLSASYGTMGHNHGGPNPDRHGGDRSQKINDSAAFASQQQLQQRPVLYDSQSFAGVRETGPAYRDYQSYPAMQSAFSPPQPISDGGQRWSLEPGWYQFNVPPPRDSGYSYRSEPGPLPYVSHLETNATFTVMFFYLEYPHPNVAGKLTIRYVDAGDFEPVMVSGGKPSPSGSVGLPNDGVDLQQMYRDHRQPLYLPPLESDLSIASRALLRETTTVAALNAVAHDIAFQEFSPSLFQANTTTDYDSANVGTLGLDSTQSEAVDGLIRPADESNNDVIANSTDAVVREREAVDAVLEDLHDIDSLLPATESGDLNVTIDQQTETALDQLPAGEIDGGMVLLQSTGDANGSGFDLTQVYAEQVERFSAPAKMETSVGMFQAVDVASDEAPIVETAPQSDATTELNRESGLDEKLPTKRDPSSTNKAATLIGATTLTGALVWLNRSGSRFSQQKPALPKRRASRS